MSSVRIEAESYKEFYDRDKGNFGTAKNVYKNDVDVYYGEKDNYFIGRTAAKEFLTYTIDVPEDGEYRLSARIASKKNYTKKLKISVDDQPATNFNISGSTGGWASWREVDADTPISLSKGTHTLKLEMLTGGFKIDYLDLVRSGDLANGSGGTGGNNNSGSGTGGSDSSGSGSNTGDSSSGDSNNSGSGASGSAKAIQVEAEDYKEFVDSTPGNAGDAYRNNDVDIVSGGGSNNGHYVTDIQKREALSYEINVAESGEYQLNARVAAGGRRVRRFKLTVDGKRVEFRLENPKGWENWQNITADDTVSLAAGKYTVQIYMISDGFNFDSFELVPLKTTPAAPVTVRQVDLNIDGAIKAGSQSENIVGSSAVKTVSYERVTSGVSADLDEATVTFGGTTNSVNPASLGRLKIMPLGDSITRGGEPFDMGGYRDDLRQMLVSAGYDVDFVGPYSLGPGADNQHAGVGGESLDEISARVVSKPGNPGVVRTYRPDVVLLMAGTNDNFRNLDFVNAHKRLDRLIGEVTREHPGVQVLVGSIPPTRVKRKNKLITNEGVNNPDESIYGPNKIRQVVAKHRNATFVDIFNSLEIADILTTDKVHPTTRGNARIAQAWFEGIEKTYRGVSRTVDTLQGIANVVGTERDDILIGNDAVNVLAGRGGDDVLVGGKAADRFVLTPNGGFDTIQDFQAGQDLLVLANGLAFAQIDVVSGADVGHSSQDAVVLYNDDKIALLSGVNFSAVTANSFATTPEVVV